MPRSPRAASEGSVQAGKKKPATKAAERIAKKAFEEKERRSRIDNDKSFHLESPMKLAELLKEATRGAFFTKTPDWSNFVAELSARTADSPRWFLQVYQETLPMVPGVAGDPVDIYPIQIFQAAVPTKPPMYTVVREHAAFANVEDLAPEKLVEIHDLGLVWRRLILDDGADVNAFVLSSKGAAAASSVSFGFAAAPTAVPAPAAPAAAPVGFGGSATSAATKPSFGFGAAAAPQAAPAAAPSFGFGAAAAPTTTASFGFGAAAPSPAVSTTAAPAVAFSGSKTANPWDVTLSLWTKQTLRAFERTVKGGSRVLTSVSHAGETYRVKMDNEHLDAEEAVQLNCERYFLSNNALMQRFSTWAEAVPADALSGGAQAEVSEVLSKARRVFLDELEEGAEFKQLVGTVGATVQSKVTEVQDQREAALDKQLGIIGGMRADFDAKLLAARGDFTIMKYYPKNDVVQFNPHSKVSGFGICEMGQHVDRCVPAPVVKVQTWGLPAV